MDFLSEYLKELSRVLFDDLSGGLTAEDKETHVLTLIVAIKVFDLGGRVKSVNLPSMKIFAECTFWSPPRIALGASTSSILWFLFMAALPQGGLFLFGI
ncbi:hypothetical protein [Pseudomonas sp. BN411]|uniref:hypothetical protein n=1 Tax=Pseudomonas sp. BN411 TaxID=2567887 RepID=UPI00245480B9|nr:hypothetical protein [Pseudomonas sp. BN411]MDH4563913.1 hypothetical protein [Pseudomonas sp. BN411]